MGLTVVFHRAATTRPAWPPVLTAHLLSVERVCMYGHVNVIPNGSGRAAMNMLPGLLAPFDQHKLS